MIGTRPRILVVEDEEDLRANIRYRFRKEGFETLGKVDRSVTEALLVHG